MGEKKVILAATLVALTVFGAPLAASAAPTHSVQTIGGISIHADDHEDDHEDDGDDDEDDGDDEHHGSIPPVFVTPTTPKAHTPPKHKPSSTSHSNTNTSTNTNNTTNPASINPAPTDGVTPVGPEGVTPVDGNITNGTPGQGKHEEGRAVDITRVPERMKTPADQFMDTAYVGLGMLGVSAVGLAVTAGVRAVRIRRSGKSDYFYDNK